MRNAMMGLVLCSMVACGGATTATDAATAADLAVAAKVDMAMAPPADMAMATGDMASICKGTWVDLTGMCDGTKKGSDYCPMGKTAVAARTCNGSETNPGASYFTMYNFEGCSPGCASDINHVTWAALCCE